MLRSMTGFSRIQREEPEFTLAVSVKSINHRFLDLQVRLPSGLDALEPTLRNLVKEHIARGHVEVQVSVDRLNAGSLDLDRRLLGAYLKAVQALRQEFGFAGEPDLVALLRIPGMVASANGEVAPALLGRIREVLEQAMTEALRGLNAMKAYEGEILEKDVRARLARLSELAGRVQRLSEDVPQLHRRRLERRLNEMLGSSGRNEVDPARLAQEVAFLASRSDIAEELTRFRSHLEQIQPLLAESSEVGKKLDFLLQEMNREANTMLAKTTDVPEVGVEITQQAIEMKAEIEKLREQAQNIE